jgi:hypothetical protein
MPKPGFTRNAKVIAGILHNDPGGQAAVDDGAERILAQMSEAERATAFLSEPYHTDRYVRAVMVPADDQAKHGTGTRAGQAAASNG